MHCKLSKNSQSAKIVFEKKKKASPNKFSLLVINIKKWFKGRKAVLVLSQKTLILNKLKNNVLDSALTQIYDINKSSIKHFMSEITC